MFLLKTFFGRTRNIPTYQIFCILTVWWHHQTSAKWIVSQAFSQDARCRFTFGNCQVFMSKWLNRQDYIISPLTVFFSYYFKSKMPHFQRRIEFLRYIPFNFNGCCTAFCFPMFLPMLFRRNKWYKCLPHNEFERIKCFKARYYRYFN